MLSCIANTKDWNNTTRDKGVTHGLDVMIKIEEGLKTYEI